MAWKVVERGHPLITLFLVSRKCSYCRPSEMLSLRQKDRLPSTSGLFRYWSVLLAPVEPDVGCPLHAARVGLSAIV